MTPLELLAPARTADIGIAAIRCGADAVYIGGPDFGARVSAANSIEDIRRLCEAASEWGAGIFVTVNTLARNDTERRQAVDMMMQMRGIGINAFILQDTSLLPLLAGQGGWKEEFHASTQCAIRTPERALQLADMGFSRLILERQLSLGQIRAIRQAVPASVELEAFVHGAVCMCYSGDCYLSEHLTGRSANRGECAQPCRNLYDLMDAEGNVIARNRALLSLRDLSLAGRLDDLVRAGVTSFKIEGRLKGESYVKNVVRAYSLMLDRIVGESGGKLVRSSFGTCHGGFTPDLDKTFNRGYTELYLDGTRGGWSSKDAAGALGEYAGKVEKSGRTWLVLRLERGIILQNGDGLCHAGTDGRVEGFRVEKVLGAGSAGGVSDRTGCTVKIAVKEDVTPPAPGSRIWRNFDMEFERSLEKNMPQRLLEAGLTLSFKDSVKVCAVREDGAVAEAQFSLEGMPEALDRERMNAVMSTQLTRSAGRNSFHIDRVECDGPLPLMSAAFLNSVRRHMAGLLDAVSVNTGAVANRNGFQPCRPFSVPSLTHPRHEGELMRSRYCIRAELGMCLKKKPTKEGALFLRNNGKLLALNFDCRNCEMTVTLPVNR